MKGAWTHWKLFPQAVTYLRPYRLLSFTSIVMTGLSSVVALAEPWPLAIMVDSVLGDNPPPGFLNSWFGLDPGRYELLAIVVAAGFLQVILAHGLIVVHDYVNAKVEQNMVLDLRSQLFDHIQRLSLTFHDERRTGQLMQQVNLQASALGAVLLAFPPLAQSFLTLIGMLTIALLIDWQVTLISLVAVPMIYYALGLYGTRIVPRIQKVQSLEWQSISIVYEALAMLRVIVSFGREKYEHRRFRDQGQTAVDERVKLTIRQTLFTLAVTAATAAGTALVLGFGALHVIQNKITIGELLVLMTYISQVYQPLEQISATIGQLHAQFVFLGAALGLLDTEPEVREDPQPVHVDRAKGRLAFENVNFAYKGREDTLTDISFEAEPGQRIAIVGPTGAGKTTLISLLIRFYEPNTGRVTIDGVDIRRFTLADLRSQIAVVLQEPMLFSGTIADNIRYGRLEATMDEIHEAARCANAHDFISSLPNGYQTELGEGGAQLSGGERQRICVARAFVRDAPILILDEPTSSIDSKTENVILDALDELMVGRTSFMIAHRLSTVRDADKILVLSHGHLVEQGPHDELVETGGLYSQLYSAQRRKRAKAKSRNGSAPPSEPGRADEPGVALSAEQPNGGQGEPPEERQDLDRIVESVLQTVRPRVRTALEGENGEGRGEGHGGESGDSTPPAEGDGASQPEAKPSGAKPPSPPQGSNGQHDPAG